MGNIPLKLFQIRTSGSGGDVDQRSSLIKIHIVCFHEKI